MARKVDLQRFLLKPGGPVALDRWDPAATDGFDGGKSDGMKELADLREKMDALQDKLYAEHKHALLVVLQGMDASGKDGTIRRVFEGVNPEGVRVAKFGVPTPQEHDHDFLWRVHLEAPRKGEIVIFNRSHYESVLVERVHGLVPPEVWKERYGEINDFERMLTNEGTIVLKFYLHIDKAHQKERFEDRISDPEKHWKFSANDLAERHHWSEYMKAYEDALEKTGTKQAPWYLVPSDHSWFRDLIVCTALVRRMEGLDLRYPPLPKKGGPAQVR